jgi:hypothetical protein
MVFMALALQTNFLAVITSSEFLLLSPLYHPAASPYGEEMPAKKNR